MNNDIDYAARFSATTKIIQGRKTMTFISLNETFSSTLRELMCEHGISQRELARKTGVSVAMINYYCQGLKFPKAQTLYYLAHYFNVSMEYLLTGED